MFLQNEKVRKLDECLACSGINLQPVLDLNSQPLANSYKKTQDDTQESYPLAINRCANCYHVQLSHIVNPDLMFKDYKYVSGTSETMDKHFKWFAEYTVEYFSALSALKPSRVLDIGCNDGSQLNHFKNLRLITHGIDPALNLYPISSKRHMIYPTYFDFKFIEDNPGSTYDIIVAQNVFAHNYNPKSFLDAARNIMTNDSLLFIQTSQADMILNGEFDTIYHEHLSFFNVRSMRILCERAGLYLIDVIKCPLHGNSYIFVVSKNKIISRPANIKNIEDMENNAGLYRPSTYLEYKLRAEAIRSELKTVLLELKQANQKIIGYGAAAKGMTLLNFCGLTNDIFDYIVDDSPLKHGLYTPGTNIPIVEPSVLFLESPETEIAFVPLAWNFYHEIQTKIDKIRSERTKDDLMVRYFPEVGVHIL